MNTAVGKSDVAKGAGVVALSRLGALVEVVSQPAYVWMFGIAVYGVYTVLWAAVNTVSNVADLAITRALQRVIPQSRSEREVLAALKAALLLGVVPSIIVAALVMAFAGDLAALVNAGPREAADMRLAILIFAPGLPLWSFIELVTAAARARRAFGPEVRLRLFWEQCVRLVLAFGLFLAGWDTLALVTAHTASLFVTAILAVRLLARYYDVRAMWHTPFDGRISRHVFVTGISLLPINVVYRVLIDLPPLVINGLIPGNAGAVASGLYGIARKVATIPQLLQQVFQYVLAPLTAAQAAVNRLAIEPLYAFATRLSTVVVLPMAAFLCLIGDRILWLFTPDAVAALPVLVVLVLGRAIETAIGPARPVIEMIGHRLLPTLNGVLTIGVWAAVTWWRVPIDGAVGMAWAVAAASVSNAFLPLAELTIAHGFRPFGWRFLLCVGLGLAGAAILMVADLGLAHARFYIELPAMFALMLGVIWLGLRFGLARSDRGALGSLGARIGLAPATPSS
ncbi:polysaccharide biosynthesis protein [Sphingosinicella sp.]|uniref:polysaccharide biosynthesis protein n=1 Tax=Sphingosinicella sp. TaxID=1917971 RepID=UPI00261D2ACD|nr:polysaccharide biosynthesis protein [Sphingosinicella sp.]